MRWIRESWGQKNSNKGRDRLEIHFGKQVVARVRKCRLVVVKNRLHKDEEIRAEERPED